MLESYEEIYIVKVLMKGFNSPASELYFHWDRGVAALGDQFSLIDNFADDFTDDADCYYQRNLLKPTYERGDRALTHGAHLNFIANSQKPFIVCETNVFRKCPGWMRFGWQSYRWDEGNFNNADVDSTRWNQFEKQTNISFKDWSKNGEYIVIVGQKFGDSALLKLKEQGFDNFVDWVTHSIIEIRRFSDRKIIIRPHPMSIDRGIKIFSELLENQQFKNVELCQDVERGKQGGESLDNLLKDAHCVVTYNSLTAIEAVCEGIPVFAYDSGSMAWPIAHTDLSQIENLNYDIDLQDWKNKIAYTIWNKKEVTSGECWAHLKPVYFN